MGNYETYGGRIKEQKNIMTTETPEDDVHTIRIVTNHPRKEDRIRPYLGPKEYEVDLINAPKDVDWDWWNRKRIHELVGYIPRDFFKEGSLSGKLTEWFEDGKCKLEENFINGVRNGYCFYENRVRGDITYGQYKNGEPEGKWELGLEVEEEYKDGKIIKWTRTLYPGRLVGEVNYKDGVQHGRESYWHDNGQPSGLSFYEEGVKISGSSWYENGQKQSQVKRNRFTGEEKWLRWYEDGQIKY
jgi:antitoxin component YwqK of YwqJK toxin-antitoxin module